MAKKESDWLPYELVVFSNGWLDGRVCLAFRSTSYTYNPKTETVAVDINMKQGERGESVAFTLPAGRRPIRTYIWSDSFDFHPDMKLLSDGRFLVLDYDPSVHSTIRLAFIFKAGNGEFTSL